MDHNESPNEVPLHGVASFYKKGRALVDARRDHLARVAMMPEHVSALEMPDMGEHPRAPPVIADPTPKPNQAEGSGGYKPPKLPKLPGVNADVGEEE